MGLHDCSEPPSQVVELGQAVAVSDRPGGEQGAGLAVSYASGSMESNNDTRP